MEEFSPTNREKSRKARGRSFYCKCDRNMVNAGEKCAVCHRRGGKNREKAK